MKRMRVAHVVYMSFVLALFAMATVGFYLVGDRIQDALYHAVQIFFLECAVEKNGNVFIDLCKFLCPVMTATGLLALLKNAFQRVMDGLVSGRADATAVYCDTDRMHEIGEGFCNPVFMERQVSRRALSHVLLFERDMDNLRFYEQMKPKLRKGSQVYIKLDQMEPNLLKEDNVRYFNVNEILARVYWQERHLQKYLTGGALDTTVAIIGFGLLGQSILNYGLMNNIYTLDQRIQYHVWGESRLYRNLLGNFDKMNGDTITYHDGDWTEELELLKGAHRIIVTTDVDMECLQTLIYLSSDGEIDFYDPLGVDLSRLYVGDRLTAFGVLGKVLTEENIKTDKLYSEAKKVNYAYLVENDKSGEYTWESPDAEEKMEKAWMALNSFIKGSNVACADYHNIRLLVMEALGLDAAALTPEQEEELAEMEHIRWSRYHFVNHWHYDEKRDNSKRRHHLLIPYETLPEDEKEKDRCTVKRCLGIKGTCLK